MTVILLIPQKFPSLVFCRILFGWNNFRNALPYSEVFKKILHPFFFLFCYIAVWLGFLSEKKQTNSDFHNTLTFEVPFGRLPTVGLVVRIDVVILSRVWWFFADWGEQKLQSIYVQQLSVCEKCHKAGLYILLY